jgi:uncharacterized membrane protein SpoIIM required for sporulation
MNLSDFVEKRQTSWRQLEQLLDRARHNMGGLSERDLDDLGRLYRMTTSDLALAQRDFPGQRVSIYLNQLVARAHAVIYRGEPLQWRQVRRFFTHGFPQLYRQLLPYTIVSFLLFMLPALAAFFIVWSQPDSVYVVLGDDFRTRELVHEVEQGELWTDIAPSVRSAASSLILTNNIQVTFLTFAGGMTLGLFTIYVLIFNGLSIGGVFGLLQAHGLSGGLGEFVAAHGFIELSVIFLAGGCGLYLADGILRPGLLSRRESLVRRGQTAMRLILGCVPLLILAGLIEGFISPSSLPWWVKLFVGLSTGIMLYAYWLRAGREPVVSGQWSVVSTSRSMLSP